nr:MAG TPA: hypothetical protein [Caudoviricetes sp.]
MNKTKPLKVDQTFRGSLLPIINICTIIPIT